MGGGEEGRGRARRGSRHRRCLGRMIKIAGTEQTEQGQPIMVDDDDTRLNVMHLDPPLVLPSFSPPVIAIIVDQATCTTGPVIVDGLAQ